MASNKDYKINVSLESDTSGLSSLSSGLKSIEDRVDKLTSHDVDLRVNISGNAGEELNNIKGQLDSLKSKDINVTLGGNVETSLRNIEGHLESLSKNFETRVNVGGDWDTQLRNIHGSLQDIQETQTLKIDIDMGRSVSEIQSIASALSALSDEIRTISGTHLGDVAGLMVHGFQSANNELGKIQREISTIGSGSGSDVGNKLARDFYDAGNQVGNIQRQLNSLRAPDLSKQMNLNSYYGSYDQLGRLNLGSIGGSSILSMVGVQGFKNVTWGNASTEQTNNILLQKMDRDTSAQISAATFEGGTDTITHAVSQNRSVRNPDLIAQLYAFKMATNASNEQLMSNVFGGEVDTEWGSGSMVDVLAAFGENVALQTGSEQLGTSAMFDLAKAFGGQYASVDQYGISEDTLKQHGYDPKDENITEFMRAVGEIIGADAPNELMNTTEGGMTKVRKRFHRAGRMIGQMMMGPVDFLSNLFLQLDTKDMQIFGMKIPAGTFTQAIIGITGLVSSIQPLQQTLHALQDTFNRVTGAVETFKDGFTRVMEKLSNLGHGDLASDFTGIGAEGILRRESLAEDIRIGEIVQTSNVRGLHDFSYEDVEKSSMSWDQKRRTRNRMGLDEKLFTMERKTTSDFHKSIHDFVTAGKDLNFEKEISELSEMEKIQARSREAQRKMDAYDIGRMNEISQLSSWKKIKMGIGGSFKPQTTAFGSAYSKAKSAYKGEGFLNQVKSQTIGRLRGLRAGFSALRETGGITNSFKSLGGVLKGVLLSINPLTIAFGVLGGIMAGLAAIFLVANANSDDFRTKLANLMNRLHDLFDMVMYTLGDLFQKTGLSEKGGIEGIIEVANKILDALTQMVVLLTDVLSAWTGRDLEQSKKTDPLKKEFDKTLKGVKETESKEGKWGASPAQYQKLLHLSDQIRAYDPAYFTDKRLEDMGLTGDNYTDDDGKTFASYLQRDLSGTQYDYVSETQLEQAEKNGVHLDADKLREALKDENGKYDPEKVKKFETALHEQSAHMNVKHFGKDWNDSEFARETGLYTEYTDTDPKAGDTVLGHILDPVLDALWWIGGITGAILAILAAEKGLSYLSKLDKLWKGAKGTTKVEKIKDILSTKIHEKYPTLSEWWKNKGIGDKINDVIGRGPEKKRKIDPIKSTEDIKKELDLLKKERNTSIFTKAKDKIFDSSIGKRLLPEDGMIRKFAGKLSQAYTDISNNSFREWLQSSKRLEKLSAKITSKLPHLSSLVSRLTNSNTLKTLFNTSKGFLKELFPKGFEGIFGKLGGFLAGKLGGKALVGAIPVIGQIIDALWIAWDLTSWIGDFLDANIPWLGQIFTIVSPLRSIQKSWDSIMANLFNFGGAIKGFFNSLGLGFVADGLQWIWDKLVEIYNFVQNIPILGWLLPGDPVKEGGQEQQQDQNANKTADATSNMEQSSENLNATTYQYAQSVGKTGVLNNDANVYGGGNTIPYDYGINPSLNNGAAYVGGYGGYSNGVQRMYNGQPLPNNNNNGTINNNVTISGFENGEQLSRLVINTLNEKILFNAQKAGRTVDGQPNVSL